MEHIYIERLIAKELLGQTFSTEEQQMLDSWLDQSEQNRTHYERIRQNEFSSARYEAYTQIDDKKAFQQFLKRTKKSFPLKIYIRNIVACLVPLLLIGCMVWFKYFTHQV